MSAKTRVGFIGAGWWATSNHMPILAGRDDVEMAAVCRLGAAELAQVKERFGFAFATEDYRELLRQPLDAVVIASPHTLHAEHARAALEAGLHVMVEKPPATRAADARELERLARERQRHFLVPYGWNYKPFVEEAARLIREIGIGEIQYVVCQMGSPTGDLFFGGGQDLQGEGLFPPDPATWGDPVVAGGGYGQGQLTHALGLLFFLAGDELRAQEVFAMMSAPGARVDIYDALSVRFANGAIGSIGGSGRVPAYRRFQVDVRLFGSEGMALVDVERERVEIHRHDRRAEAMLAIPDGAGDYECVAPVHRFVELVQGRPVANNSHAGIARRTVETLDAAYRSVVDGRAASV
jgi:predicted dehydrogenase